MSTNYPTGLDTLTNPTATDSVATVSHSSQHANANDAIEALQTKVGIDGSAVTTSHDYKLSEVTGSDKAVSKTATQTLTNKTLTNPTINAATITGTVTDSSTRTITGAVDAGGAPSFEIPNSAAPTVDANGEIAVDTTVADMSHGVLKYFGGEEIAVIGVPIAEMTGMSDGDVVSYNATNDEFELKQPTTTTVPGPTVINVNPLSPSTDMPDTMWLDTFMLVTHRNSGNGFAVAQDGVKIQARNATSEWADSNEIRSIVVLGLYLYILAVDTDPATDTWRVYRYLLSDITSSPTQMTFSGSNQLTATNSRLTMSCDGTDFYFTYLAGNSANDYVIGKYTLSGTTLTYSSTITLAGTPALLNSRFNLDTSGNIYIIDSSSQISKFNSSGTNVYTGGVALGGSYDDRIMSIGNDFYVGDGTAKIYYKMPV